MSNQIKWGRPLSRGTASRAAAGWTAVQWPWNTVLLFALLATRWLRTVWKHRSERWELRWLWSSLSRTQHSATHTQRQRVELTPGGWWPWRARGSLVASPLLLQLWKCWESGACKRHLCVTQDWGFQFLLSLHLSCRVNSFTYIMEHRIIESFELEVTLKGHLV